MTGMCMVADSGSAGACGKPMRRIRKKGRAGYQIRGAIAGL
jgi:hypothetical protein